MKKKNFLKNLHLKYTDSPTKKILKFGRKQEKRRSVKIEARKIAQRLGLEMKVTDVEYQGDASKLLFIIRQIIE
jgi:methyl coenzyme M reductase alpha subunit